MTDKQKQCLLEYLGYYSPENSNKVNNVDGIVGAMTKNATIRFQKDYGLTVDGIIGKETEEKLLEVVYLGEKPGVNWDSIKYFKRDEFRCKCGGKFCNGFDYEPSKLLVETCDKVREHFGKPMIVSSGVRCDTHNLNVGGVANSRHLFGRAVDFMVTGVKSSVVLDYVKTLPEVAYCYAIDINYIHMDFE